MAETFDFRDSAQPAFEEGTVSARADDRTAQVQDQRAALVAMTGGSSELQLPNFSVTGGDANSLAATTGSDTNPMKAIASAADGNPDAPPAPADKAHITDKKDAATAAKIAKQLDDKDTLDVKSLSDLMNKYIKGAADPRAEAEKVLADISAQSQYKLTLQGNGNFTMVYKQFKNVGQHGQFEQGRQGKNELIRLPAVNVPPPRHPFGNP